MFTRGQILFKAQQSNNHPRWSDELIIEAFGVTAHTIDRVRKQLVEEEFNATLSRRK